MSQISFLTDSLLRSILTSGMTERGDIADADTCLTPGIYRVKPTTTGLPQWNWGMLIVFRVLDVTFQVYVNLLESFDVFCRVISSSGASIKAWRQIQFKE